MATLQESASSILAEKNEKVIPENIKAGVTIFGITGSVKELDKVENLDLSTATKVENEGDSIKVTGTPVEGIEVGVDTNSNITVHCPDSEIVTAKGITSGQIIQGQTVLGLEGTGQTGVDTSDATASANDIIKGKTAYANNEILTGTIEQVTEVSSSASVVVGTSDTTFSTSIENRSVVEGGTNVKLTTGNSNLASKIGLTSEVLAEGTTILGVTGTAEVGGIDTSDATASYADIMEGKFAYANGKRIDGWIKDNGSLSYTPSTIAQTIPEGYTSGGTVYAVTSEVDSNIIPENIRAGVTILGVSGTAESGAGGVKLFTTTDELNADTGVSGDLAVVYGDTTRNMQFSDTVTTFSMPQTVVFDTAVTGSYDCLCNTSGSLEGCYLRLDSNYFSLSAMNTDTYDSYDYYYHSDDGITYTYDYDTAPTNLTLPGAFKPSTESDWTDLFGYFIQLSSKAFTGFYQHNGTSYEIAPNDFTLNNVNQLMPGVKAYGTNGVITGDGSLYTSINYTNIYKNLGFDPYANHTLAYSYASTAGNSIIKVADSAIDYTSKDHVLYAKKNKYSNAEGYYLLKTKYVDILYKFDSGLNYYKVYDKEGNFLYEETIETTEELDIISYNVNPNYIDESCHIVTSNEDGDMGIYHLVFTKESLTYTQFTCTGLFVAGIYNELGDLYYFSRPSNKVKDLYLIANGTTEAVQLCTDTTDYESGLYGQLLPSNDGYIYGVFGNTSTSSYQHVFYCIDAANQTLISHTISKTCEGLYRDISDLKTVYLLQQQAAYSSSYYLYSLNNGTKTQLVKYTDFDGNSYSNYIAKNGSTYYRICIGDDRIEVNGSMKAYNFDEYLRSASGCRYNGNNESTVVAEYAINSNSLEIHIQDYKEDDYNSIQIYDLVYHFDELFTSEEGIDNTLPLNDGTNFRLAMNNNAIV